MADVLRVMLAGSVAAIALALAGGCDKTATAGGSGGPTSVIRGAPINKTADATPAGKSAQPGNETSLTLPNAGKESSVSAEPAPKPPQPTAATASPGTTVASPDIAKKPAPAAPTATPGTSDASAKPDRASLRPAVKKSKDDKTPVGVLDKDRPEYLRVEFDELASYDYDPYEAMPPDLGSGPGAAAEEYAGPTPTEVVKNAQIPQRIMALDKKKIIVQGFMVPIEFKRDSVRSFLLVRNQMMCCFGAMIGMNEWIMVQMDGEKRTTFVQDVPMTVFGELEVGEDIQNGMVMSLYRLKGFETQFKGGR